MCIRDRYLTHGEEPIKDVLKVIKLLPINVYLVKLLVLILLLFLKLISIDGEIIDGSVSKEYNPHNY